MRKKIDYKMKIRCSEEIFIGVLRRGVSLILGKYLDCKRYSSMRGVMVVMPCDGDDKGDDHDGHDEDDGPYFVLMYCVLSLNE